MNAGNTSRFCAECGEPLSGRIDKKFCNDMCRNAFNNRQLSTSRNSYVRRISRLLLKNRSILEDLLGHEEMCKVPGYKLRDSGFDFKHFTHLYTNRKQQHYYFVYEYGYLCLEKDNYLIVKREPKD